MSFIKKIFSSLFTLPELVSGDEFTDRFIEIAKRLTDREVTRFSMLEVDYGEIRVDLGNAYSSYRREPDNLDGVLERYAAALIETSARTESYDSVDITLIVPVVKPIDFIEQAKRQLAAYSDKPVKDSDELYFESLSDSLVVVYAEDGPMTTRFLNRANIDDLRLAPDALRELAIENLQRQLPDVEIFEKKGLSQIIADGTYEPSLLLSDPLWESPDLSVKGDVVVAVPGRGELYLTGSDDRQLTDLLQRVSTQAYNASAYPISPELYVRRDGNWSTYAG